MCLTVLITFIIIITLLLLFFYILLPSCFSYLLIYIFYLTYSTLRNLLFTFFRWSISFWLSASLVSLCTQIASFMLLSR